MSLTEISPEDIEKILTATNSVKTETTEFEAKFLDGQISSYAKLRDFTERILRAAFDLRQSHEEEKVEYNPEETWALQQKINELKSEIEKSKRIK
mmetsp:Transcript_3336/g.5053  ORF Transcript_3336/g.5053 Transcript_3336/m.5053 type:complete len:95 (+) Transcript_3336:610-894(+)